MSYYVFKNGKQEGPYEEVAVRELLEEGTYLENDPALRDGMTEWHPLGEVLGLTSPPPLPVPTEPTSPPPSEPIVAAAPSSIPQLVVVTDISMPFGSMVIFILKWSLAAIPAMLILGTIAMLTWVFFFTLLAGVISRIH